MVYQLVYRSSATEMPEPDDLMAMIDELRSRNAFLGVTGLLLYSSGTYMQVLEGEEEAVLSLFERIKTDPRHRDVVVLLRGARLEREFADWSMAFHDLASPELLATPGFSSYLNDPLHYRDTPEDQSRVRALLDSFRQGLRQAHS